MELRELLSALCAAPSVAGAEDRALAEVNRCAPAGLVFERDRPGNFTAVLNPDAPVGVMLLAHVDKTGCMVTGIDEATGFLRLGAVGSVDARAFPAQRVTVYGRRDLPGVVVSTPPHLKKAGDDKKLPPADKLTVDCGLPYDEIKALVRPGDRVQLVMPPAMLSEHVFTAPYLDNCAGVAAALLAAEQCAGRLNVRLELVLSAQEEVGSRGATAALNATRCVSAVAIDATFAAYPGIKEAQCAPMGSGARIGVSPILDKALSDRLIKTAKEKNIPYTVEVMGRSTGTDADKIGTAGSGKRAGLVSIPVRYMHQTVETVDLRDIEAAAALLAAALTDWPADA